MGQASIRMAISVAIAAGLLSGCEEGAKGTTNAKASVDAEAPVRRVVRSSGKDVEAPDVFSTTDKALWDGRPSFGGIWVASPDAKGAERVQMTNTASGKTVTGALFQREVMGSGPKLQISSDAAAALGLLAGQPGTIKVVALRRDQPQVVDVVDTEEEAAKKAAEAAKATGDAKAEDAAKTVGKDGATTAAKADPKVAELGAAAVEAIGKGDPKKAADGAAKAADPVAAAPVAAEPKKKKGLFGGLFGGGGGAKPKPTTQEKAQGAPLTAIDPVQAGKTPAKAASVEQTTLAAPAGAQPAATGGAVTIMIGAFSVEDNAKAAAAALGKAGLTANVRTGKAGGKPIWSVSASGTGKADDLLAKVKKLGFKDAYVSN